MGEIHFDTLIRSLTEERSRRRALGGLLGSLGILGLDHLAETEAKKKKKKKKKTVTNPAGTVPPPTDPCVGVVCAAVQNGTSGCVGGTCVVTACDAGFRNCDGLLTTGCETEVQTNLQDCGTCGNVCPGQGEPNTTVTCVNGTCQKRRTNDVVISQIYTAGGVNAAATFTNDYVELFNRGTTPVALDGWSLQFSAADGATWISVALAGTLPGGRYFLVKGAAGGSTTSDLPHPYYSANTLSIDSSSGRLALVDSTTTLTCGVAAGCATAPGVIDFVGYGSTAVSFEGSGPAPTPTNKNALFRLGGGCTDANNNAVDFTLIAAAPRTSATPVSPCG